MKNIWILLLEIRAYKKQQTSAVSLEILDSSL